MDKYTVDLDQVLNDFEYSELTDQHSKNVAERMQSNVSFQAPPVTKHSINNVFHSLNEYLNSGINHGKGGTSYVPENIAKELGVNDNKIDYNPVQTFSKTEDIQNNLTESIKNNLVELPESLNQSEQITFQDSNGYDEKSNVELNLPIQSGKLLDIDVTVTENNVNQVKSITETCSSTNEEHPNFVNPETSTEQIIGLRSDYFEKSNVDSIKTETFNFLLPDTGQAEAQLIPELNCMGSSKEKESNNVHIDLECDRSVLDKADSVLGKDEANFGGNESYSEAKDVIEKVTVNNAEINEDSDDVNKKSIPILVNIKDDDIQNVDSSSKLENLVIEVSGSSYQGSYAIGEADHLTQAPENATKKEIQPIDEVHDQPKNEILTKPNENASLEKDHDAEASKDDSLDSNQSSLLPEDSVNLKTTATNNDEADSDRNEEFQTPIGFSTDIDIDESELHKMLEDLELEEDMSNPEDNASGEHASKDRADEIKVTSEPQRVENNEIETKEQDNSIKIMPDSESVEEVTTETQIISSDVKASSNAQPTSNNLSEENAESEEKTIPLQIECLELEKPRKNKKSSKNKIQSDQSEESTTTVQYTQEILEDQFEHIEQEVKNEELALEKDQPQEVVSRPQNLPLNNEVKDDNVGRKINLIGMKKNFKPDEQDCRIL